MTREPYIAHSELTNEIYIVVGKEKYRVTEQAIKAVMAIKALKEKDILDKIKAEIEVLPKTYPFINHFDMYVKEDDVKRIIDKYKAESEDKNES